MSTINAITNTAFSYKTEIRVEPGQGRESRMVQHTAEDMRLEGVTFVVPEGYSDLNDYMEHLRAQSEANLDNPQPAHTLPGPSYTVEDCFWPKNDVGHDWLNVSTDFIKDLAGKVEEYERELKPLDVSDMAWYANRALEFFGGYGSRDVKMVNENGQMYLEHTILHTTSGERNLLQNQIMDAIRELSQQIKSGKGDSLDTLESKLTIGGVDMTLGELVKIQKGMREIAGTLDELNGFSGFAAAGLSKAAVKRFAQSELSDGAAALLEKVYAKRVDNHFEKLSQMSTYSAPDRDKVGAEQYYFQQANIDPHDSHTFNYAAMQKFSELDVSSDDAFRKSYTQTVDWFTGELSRYFALTGGNQTGGIQYAQQYLTNMMNRFVQIKKVDVSI